MCKLKKSVLSIVLAVIFCLTGCVFVYSEETIGGTGNVVEQFDDGPITEEPMLTGVLELELPTNESDSETNTWTILLDEFEKDTGIKTKAYIGSQVITQLNPRWRDGTPPDICLLGGTIPIEAWMRDGRLYDITELLQTGLIYRTEKKISDYVYAGAHTKEGKDKPNYLAGIACGPYGVLYDSHYINKYGKAPENYEELQDFITKVKAGGDTVFTTYGNTGSYPTRSMIMNAVAPYGQEFMDKILLGDPTAWASDEMKGVLSRWREFCNTPGVMIEGTATFDHTLSQQKWLNHEAMLIGNGVWLPGEVKNTTPENFKMEFITSPLTLKGQDVTLLAGSRQVMIAKKAKNLENAKAFVRYLYTKKAQAILATGFGYMGVRKDMEYASLNGMNDVSSDIIAYIERNKLVWPTYTWGDLNDVINGATHGLMTGKKSVDAVVADVTHMAEKLHNEGKLFY